MGRRQSLLLVIFWLLSGLAATSSIIFFDHQAYVEKQSSQALREITKVRATIEATIHRYFTLVLSLEAFLKADEDLYKSDTNHSFETRFQKFAQSLEERHPGIISLQLAPSAVVTFVSQQERNAKAIGHDLLVDDARRGQVIRTIIERSTIIAGPLTLKQGGQALIARKAIFTDAGTYSALDVIKSGRATQDATWPYDIPDNFWGFATMLVDTTLLYEEMDLVNLPDDYEFAIRGRHGLGEKGDVFWGAPSIFENPVHTATIALPSGAWVIAIKHKSTGYIYRAFMFGTVGFIIIILGALVLYTRQEKILAESETKAQGRFLAAMSHEIRTPMNGIIGVAEALRRSKLDEKQLSAVDKIQLNSKLLLKLVNDILDFSKLDAGKMTLREEPLEPRKIITDACTIVTPLAEKKNLPIIVDVDERVPLTVSGDPMRFMQILVNLLTNAIKFTEQGEVRIDATLLKDGDHPCLHITVTDTGIGISESEVTELFKPFTQAERSVTKRFEGSGLGLSITKSLIDLMQGSISVQSQPAKGSVFSLTIPYKEAPTTPAIQDTHATISKVETNTESPASIIPKDCRILIVDDQRMNIEITQMLLEELGFKADGVMSGVEAINAFQEKDYDIIYMDRQMPLMDGLAATREIRGFSNSETHPWIIALTASAQSDQKEEYLSAGANDFIGKPIDFEHLEASLQKFSEYTKS